MTVNGSASWLATASGRQPTIAPPPAQLPISANGIGSAATAASTCWGLSEQSNGQRTSTARPVRASGVASRAELDRTVHIMYDLVRWVRG